MRVKDLRLYFETLRHLKPSQIWWRAARQVRKPRARAITSRWRGLGGLFREAPLAGQSQLGYHRFRFLNEEAELPAAADWQEIHPDKLWRYNLHYFDDLNASKADERSAWHRDFIRRWIDENPPGHGEGWEPYPVSLRIVNWVKWLDRGHAPVPGMINSLATQAEWLSHNLEHHLLGNHLFANIKALAFAADAQDAEASARWGRIARSLLKRELAEQILADGGHFELSPMYHTTILTDVLDMTGLAERQDSSLAPLLHSLRHSSLTMLTWLRALTHPDGGIAFFNDAALGIGPNYLALVRYAAQRGIPQPQPASCLQHFPVSGYVRAETASSVLIADCAQIGPDYLPGHAHADTLSFEFSLFGRRLIVNSGTSCYGLGPERLWERGTSAHSTVEVGGQDSSEVWSGFRVARRARPRDLRITDGPTIEIACSHDGYRRLRGGPIHSRRWQLRPGALILSDNVDTSDRSAPSSVAHFHLHPDVRCEQTGERRFGLGLTSGQICELQVERGVPSLTSSRYAPEFGMVHGSQKISVALSDGASKVAISWDEPRN